MPEITAPGFPVVGDGRTISDLPAREWVECVKCLERSGAGTNGLEWALSHIEARQRRHTAFRAVSLTEFVLTPP